MLINALELNRSVDGNIATISVTDEQSIMNVMPDSVLDAMLHGRMTSQNIRIALYGLDVMIDGQIVNIFISMNRDTKNKVKQYLGLVEEKAKKSSHRKEKEKKPSERELEIEATRQAYLEKHAKWEEENRKKAAEAVSKGLVNLSEEERRKLRMEYFKQQKASRTN